MDVVLYTLGWASGWLLLCRPFGGPLSASPASAEAVAVSAAPESASPALPPRAAPEPASPALPPLSASKASADAVAVAVIIPARNEASSITGAIDALMSGWASPDELVVVDDASEDATAALARERGVRVVSAPALPAGWTGKNHACTVGVSATTAPVLVFVDADVRLASVALSGLCPNDDTLVSIQPWHDAAPGRERLSVIPTLLATMGAGTWSIAGPRVQASAAFGPVLAMTRSGYERIGGHGAVRGEPLEDVAIAQLFRRVELHTGPTWASFRMHPDGWRQQVEGWTRLLRPGMITVHPAVSLACVAWVASLIGGISVSPWCYGISAVQVWALGRRVGRFGPLTAACYPLSVVLLLVAMVCGFRRRVVWRGRTLSVPRTRAHGKSATH